MKGYGVFVLLPIALFLTVIPNKGIGAQLYKCTGLDGMPTYVSAPIEGQKCDLITRYVGPDNRWQFVGTTNDSASITIDKKTIERDKSGFTAWVQYLSQPGKVMDLGNDKYAHKLLHRYRVECAAMTMATISHIGYMESGTVIGSGTYLTPVATAIVPDSVGEMIWAAGCKKAASAP